MNNRRGYTPSHGYNQFIEKVLETSLSNIRLTKFNCLTTMVYQNGISISHFRPFQTKLRASGRLLQTKLSSQLIHGQRRSLFWSFETSESHHSCNIRVYFRFLFWDLLFLDINTDHQSNHQQNFDRVSTAVERERGEEITNKYMTKIWLMISVP